MSFKYSQAISFFFLMLLIASCLNENKEPSFKKINPSGWELLGIHPDLIDSVEFRDEDIFIDSNWHQISAATYGERYRFYLHNHYLYQKGNRKAVKLGPITDSNRLAFFEERGELLQMAFRHVGKAVPDFELTSLEGQTFSSKNLKGKIIVFAFWFKNCIPCIKEMPELNKLVEKYSDQEVVFLAPALDTEAELRGFLQMQDFDFNIFADQDQFIMEFDTPGYPTNVIIDQKGKIDALFVGGQYKGIMSKMIEEKIENLLYK